VAVPVDDQGVKLGGVGGVEGLEAEVVEDEHVNPEQFSDFAVVAVVESGRAEPFEELVGIAPAHASNTPPDKSDDLLATLRLFSGHLTTATV
jgi:hypothetical protein